MSDSRGRMTTHLALVDGRMRDEISTTHLSTDHLAAFLDGRLTGSERERAVLHFASCAECRGELTDLRSMLDTAGRGGSRPWIAAVAAVAASAAILLVIVLPRVGTDGTGVNPPRVRAEQGVRLPDGSQAIGVVSPTDRATVTPSGVQFVWHPAGAGAMYSVIVQDTAGNQVWSKSLADTSLTLPDSARLAPGSKYFWSVDARLADGNTAKSGAYSFTIR